MHPNPHTSDFTLATASELLLVGFDHGVESSILNFPYQSSKYHFELESSGFRAFQWLDQRVKHIFAEEKPYAVLCDLDWLIKDDFRLTRQLSSHPELSSVPIVAFTRKGRPFNKSTLASNFVDDCYKTPVDWARLEDRLEFLNQYKTQVRSASNRITMEQFGFRIPRAKRVFDIVGASLGIVLSAVIWLPVMLAIWLESRGPVVYKSKRVGSGYQVFDFFKFRSMYQGAEERLNEMHHLNQYPNNDSKTQPFFVKIPGDPRVTRVGRFIRKYSIDELPQFINVLRGEMSLVGNRPLPIYEAETLTNDQWSARFLAPAGITGLWQITKRSQPNMSAEERIRLDVEYAQKPYSAWGDFIILLKTFYNFVQKEDV